MKKSTLIIVLLVLCGWAFGQAAPDPTRISVGARTLGMGKAYAGLADDVVSIFTNPAGLAGIDRWQLTSMSGKILDEFNYITLSGIYPTNFGNLGMAFAGSSIGGAYPTRLKSNSDPDDPIYEIDPTQEQMSYYNNVFLISYADRMEKLINASPWQWTKDLNQRYTWLKDVKLGTNLKIFSVGLAGDGISQGNASGYELDAGIQAKPIPWLSLGGNFQNLLPFSLGGKLHYASGWEESYPANFKLGLAADVLGPADALRALGGHKVKLMLDADWEPTRPKVPTIFHLGAEWTPIDLLSIRAGIDQDMAGAGMIANNLTAGVGLYLNGFRFDYAYHQFYGAPGIDNHFFSLTYGVFPKVSAKDRVKVLSPADKTITYDPKVLVKGKVEDFEVASLRIMGKNIRILRGNTFEVEAPLNLGKNTIKIEALDNAGKVLETDKIRVLRLITYPDVAKTYWGFEQIGYIGTLGIIKGYPDGNFKPEGNITRAELSALLARTKVTESSIPTPIMKLFSDLPLSHWAAKYINLSAKLGVVKGYPDGTFRPQANITRAEGLAMIARFGEVKEGSYGQEFTDVARNYWAAPIIAGAYKAGMLQHFAGQPFEPNKKLTRAEAVEMLYRSAPVKDDLLKKLLDFETGY